MQHRTAPRDALDTMLDWAAAEGWNPGLDDAAAFFAADPDGFFVTLDDAGQPVAAISVVNHTPTFAFLGLYIVRPSDRGRGNGLALWRHALAHAGPRSIGLDGVEAQQDNYAASG
ncbi:MAG: GNAT family N-acetyltransferase, partial [Pseudomonadota bacterium]